MITIRTNLPEFKGQLDALALKARTRLLRVSLAAAGREFAKTGRQTVPVGRNRKDHVAGTLKRSIYVGRTKLTPGGATSFVSAYTGQKHRKKNRDAFYAMWVESGHWSRPSGLRGGQRSRNLIRERARASGRVRWIEGRWYLKRAFRTAQNRAVDAFYDRMTRGLNER